MSRTTLRMRVLPRFPARISGTNGIKTERDGADLVVLNDFSDMIRIPGVDNQAKTFFLSWNADLDLYSILSFTDLFSAIPGITGFMTTSVYDPEAKEQDIFAYADAGKAAALAVANASLAVANAALPKAGGVMTGAIQDAIFAPSSAPTKKAHFDLSRVTAGQDRDIIVPDISGLALTKWEIIGDYILSAASLLDVTNLSAFRKIRISGKVIPSVSGNIILRTSTDNGVSFAASASDYNYQVFYATGTTTIQGGATAAFMLLNSSAVDAGGVIVFEGNLEAFNKAESTWLLSKSAVATTGVVTIGTQGSARNSAVARNALRILPSAGTFTGTITIEGVRG